MMPNNAARLNGMAGSPDQLVKTIAWLPSEVKRFCQGLASAGTAREIAQSKRTETLSSLAMRAIASPISGAIEMTRMLRATRTASVG